MEKEPIIHIFCSLLNVFNKLDAHSIYECYNLDLCHKVLTNKPYLVFAALNAIIFLPSVLLNPFIGYFGDKFRRPKLMFYFTNMLSIVGSISYMLYYSAWYPIIGSFLLGLFPLRSIMVAEIARSYTEDEVSKKLPLFSNFYYVGLCPTVVILIFFEKVNINIGGFHIQYGNINAIFIIVMTIIIQILAVFFALDLSKEYDLKQEEAKDSKKSEYEEIKMVKNDDERKRLLVDKRPGHFENMKRLFTSFDIVLSYFLTFLFGYAELTMLKYIPIVIITKLDYSIIVLNIGLLANSLMSIAIIVFIVRVYITSKSAYYVCLVAFLSMIVVGFLFLLMNSTNSYTVNWILAMLLYTIFSVFYLVDDVFLVCITAKLVKSDIQSFAESFRLSFKHIASILAGLSIEMVADYYNAFYISLSLVILISLCLLLYRRKTLSKPWPLV